MLTEQFMLSEGKQLGGTLQFILSQREHLGEALLFAVANVETERVSALLRQGADPNYTYPNSVIGPMRVAIMQGHETIYELLVSAGAETADFIELKKEVADRLSDEDDSHYHHLALRAQYLSFLSQFPDADLATFFLYLEPQDFADIQKCPHYHAEDFDIRGPEEAPYDHDRRHEPREPLPERLYYKTLASLQRDFGSGVERRLSRQF